MNINGMHKRRTVLGHVLRRNPEFYPCTWIGEVNMSSGGRRIFSFERQVQYGKNQWVVRRCGRGAETYFNTLEEAVGEHLG